MNETDVILNDIRAYLRISAAAAARSVAAKTLDLQEKALVYSKMDGKTLQTKIETLTGVPNQTISRWADEFVSAGLASAPNEYVNGHRALFSLNELGIDISGLKKRAKDKAEKVAAGTSGSAGITTETEQDDK
jgi:transposase